MPKNNPQSLPLFPLDVTDSTIQELIPWRDVGRFTHSTKLPGGFFELSFTLPVTQEIFWDWRINRPLFRIQLKEDSTRVIWEGRLERIELVSTWVVRLVFRGYWRNFTDGTPDAGFSPNTTADSIIQTLRDSHIPTLQLSTSNAEMDAPGVTINQDFNTSGEGWSCWVILIDSGKGILSVGNSSDQRMDLSIYEDRVIRFKARNPSIVTWESDIVDPRGGVRRFPVDVDVARVFNNVLTVYQSGSSITRTGYASSTAALGITRDLHIPDIGESVAGNANSRRDTELAKTKELSQQTPGFVITRVRDAVTGVEQPLCHVRAGEVIRIPDFVPNSVDLDAVTLDAFSTFFIEETICDHQRGELTIRPDRESHTIATILSRNRVR